MARGGTDASAPRGAARAADATAPTLALTALIWQIDKLRKAAVCAALGPHGLSETQWLTLSLLSRGGVDTAADIARALDHNAGAMKRVVDVLERRRLLARRRSIADRRLISLWITPEGSRVADAGAVSVAAFWRDLLGGWHPNEAAAVRETLARLDRSLARPGRCPSGVKPSRRRRDGRFSSDSGCAT